METLSLDLDARLEDEGERKEGERGEGKRLLPLVCLLGDLSMFV